MSKLQPQMRYRCNCGGKLFVKETRATNDGIYRTRKCADCAWLFTTLEQAIEGAIPYSAYAHRNKNDIQSKP